MNESNVTFLPAGKHIIAPPGSGVMDLAKMLNINIAFTCGGKGKCGRCKVFVREDMETLGPLTETEKNLLSPEEVRSGCDPDVLSGLPWLPKYSTNLPMRNPWLLLLRFYQRPLPPPA